MTAATHYFNGLDYIIIGIVLFSTIISLFRGFLREAISLIVWGVGILAGLKFASLIQPLLSGWVASATVRYWIAFLIIFGFILLIGISFNIFIHRWVGKSGLNAPDRLLGFCFGVVRGLLIVAVLLMYLSGGHNKEDARLAESRLTPEFKPMVAWLNLFLPQEVKRLSQWVLDKHDEVLEGGHP